MFLRAKAGYYVAKRTEEGLTVLAPKQLVPSSFSKCPIVDEAVQTMVLQPPTLISYCIEKHHIHKQKPT